MFRAAARPSGASAQYGQIDLNARIASASPHGLVSILFEELLRAMGMVRKSTQPHRRSEALSRALSILQSLNDTLNFESGGQIATSLSAIYGEARRLLLKGMREQDTAPVAEAEAMIAEIAQSWNTISEGAAVSS
ncbi:flagellar export chaperone FliS [Sphingomonas sp. LaA6.9]|uniref:flagellar export chaperone FliS n=1 Tax=Sphingomonas sp. LaA6.9 TaxID=2919914 RepID=UPI001F503EE3|nr:flagellar export chaperone FliS [Sphingomonas sp. LaA6.9]MCJ8156364.1 flagellar export chaperone FliS [Sphingomonas sp. LaA6.9]